MDKMRADFSKVLSCYFKISVERETTPLVLVSKKDSESQIKRIENERHESRNYDVSFGMNEGSKEFNGTASFVVHLTKSEKQIFQTFLPPNLYILSNSQKRNNSLNQVRPSHFG